MAVYVFDLLTGYARWGGLEYAQGLRWRLLKDFSVPVWHIFTDLPERADVNFFYNLGIPQESMISVHQYLTDNHTLRSVGAAERKLEELKDRLGCGDISRGDGVISLIKDGYVAANLLLDEADEKKFYAVQYFDKAKLLRTEHYTEGIAYVDYFVTAGPEGEQYARLVRRTFYNRDSSVAYDQIFDGDKEWYIFPDGRSCTKPQLIAEFMKKLDLREGDRILLERVIECDFLQPLFRHRGKAAVLAVLHSGHYYEEGEDPYSLFLNREYYYYFKYSDKIDTMVVSTPEQKRDLEEKLREYGFHVPQVEVIPAGGLACLRYPKRGRRPCSILSVSRLDPRKKIDWIIKSVIKAHQTNPDISLDLYGRGSDWYIQMLRDMVSANGAGEYIRFMGHRDVTDVYVNYEVFVSASLWETWGLSVMEAVGSGNGMIGLDVKYGNRLFIRPGENGYLVPFKKEYIAPGRSDDGKLIEDMAAKIVEIFEDRGRLEEFHRNSYEIGKNYMYKETGEKWRRLLTRRPK